MSNVDAEAAELKNTGYEIFVGILSLLSIVNLILAEAIHDENLTNVLLVMNGLFMRWRPPRCVRSQRAAAGFCDSAPVAA